MKATIELKIYINNNIVFVKLYTNFVIKIKLVILIFL